MTSYYIYTLPPTLELPRGTRDSLIRLFQAYKRPTRRAGSSSGSSTDSAWGCVWRPVFTILLLRQKPDRQESYEQLRLHRQHGVVTPGPAFHLFSSAVHSPNVRRWQPHCPTPEPGGQPSAAVLRHLVWHIRPSTISFEPKITDAIIAAACCLL
ncbi:hypothetical protein GE09DRAFT_479695 [Coniochaeta sp. 2T2.1]|nr:hypothetical protein GE09DRAFT_479695 [Coniochaeta sp. 2T2.1]